jgi:hypothetical protein
LSFGVDGFRYGREHVASGIKSPPKTMLKRYPLSRTD